MKQIIKNKNNKDIKLINKYKKFKNNKFIVVKKNINKDIKIKYIKYPYIYLEDTRILFKKKNKITNKKIHISNINFK